MSKSHFSQWPLFAAKAFEEESGNGFTWRQGATLDEVVAKAEAKEAANGGKIIATDRSSKIIIIINRDS